MTDIHANFLNGYLLEWSQRSISREDLLLCPELAFKSQVTNSHWEEFEFSSKIALRNEDDLSTPGPFKYVVVCRRSGPRIVILSLNRKIVDHLLETHLATAFLPTLHRVPIAVNNLVKALAKKPTIYALSFVYARVPAFGASLRTVAFYGDDLADAAFFKDSIDLMNFSSCGLRKVTAGTECVRLSGDGSVAFHLSQPSRVLEVEEVLRFLRQEGYLPTEVLPVE